MRTKQFLSDLMLQAWQFVKRNGLSLSEALRISWLNAKLRLALALRIVKFYFQKIDGTIREAYGTLNLRRIPAATTTGGGAARRQNDTVQNYFDTEKREWRCFRKAGLIRIAN